MRKIIELYECVVGRYYRFHLLSKKANRRLFDLISVYSEFSITYYLDFRIYFVILDKSIISARTKAMRVIAKKTLVMFKRAQGQTTEA